MDYRYTPLSPLGNEIRLLHLLPGERHDPLRILIETCSLGRYLSPNYEALSYTWGDPTRCERVAVGYDGEMSIFVPKNLAQALPYLRRQSSSRVLWIDVICVNQDDPVERSRQVSLMPAIYSRASFVVVWLGPQSSDSDSAIDCIEALGRHIRYDRRAIELVHLTCDPGWMNIEQGLPFSKEQRLAIYGLLSRPWFQRLWVLQEVRLAGEHAVVQCGERMTSWDLLTNAALCVFQESTWMKEVLDSSSTILFDGGLQTLLLRLLNDTRNLSCQDPRDKVFALLSLSEDTGLTLRADYTKTVNEVFYDVAHYYAGRVQNLSFLADVVYPNQTQNLPSWVPDWSLKPTAFRLHLPYAHSEKASIVHVTRTELRVHGKLTGTVKDVCRTGLSLPIHPEHIDGFIDSLFKFAARNKLLEQLFCKTEFVERLCRTLCCDCYSESYVTGSWPGSQLTQKSAELAVMRALERAKTIAGHAKQPITRTEMETFNLQWSGLAFMCSGRSLLMMESGAIGLGPDGVMPGDRVSCILGCQSPMILRSMMEDKFAILGPAYVEGQMHAEGVLGPLPDGVEVLTSQVNCLGELLSFPVFRDKSSGIVLVEDPRLGPVPSTWIKHERNDREDLYFENKKTGESRSSGDDPRFDYEVLVQRGALLEALTLV